MPDSYLGDIRTDGGPVIHMRQPGDRVTIVFEPAPGAPTAPRPRWSTGLGPVSFRLIPPAGLAVQVFAAPDPAAKVITISDGREFGVVEARRGADGRAWLCVYKGGGRELWIKWDDVIQ